MKKILLASTALVASAGFAAAEVSISGMAEMGVYDNGNDDMQYFTDVDVTFKMSGETDGGISFGASIDLDESDGAGSYDDDDAEAVFLGTPNGASVTGASGAFAPSTQGGETIFVSYGGATLTMGDTDGAFDKAVPEMALAGGSIADDETGHAGFDDGALFDGAGDGQIARFDYAFDAFTFSVSAEQLTDGATDDTTIGAGVSYSGDFNGIAITAGLGYQDVAGDASVTGIGITAGFANGFSAGITASKYDLDGFEADHVGIGLGYEMNALAIGFNWGEFSDEDDETASGYGLAVAYDLGGGLSAKAGYGNSSVSGFDDVDTFSLGLGMSF